MRILITNDQHWPMKSGCAQASRTLALGLAVSIIGIPFALKDIQLAQLALAPVGKMVVDKP